MAAPEGAQRIQFGDDINPVKTHNSATYKKELAMGEKVVVTDIDDEEHMRRVADNDANHKRKQVRSFAVFASLCMQG